MTTILDSRGSNPPNPFSAPIRSLVASSQGFNETAADLVSIVVSSPKPAHTLWELWDAQPCTTLSSPSLTPSARSRLRDSSTCHRDFPRSLAIASTIESYSGGSCRALADS
ncbi:hypothetical protein AJ79_06776, partial [Helicocarpus griseus UAMH5409]